MAEMSGVSILQHEIEKAKDKLKDVNENIKKLTGRDPEDLRSVRNRQQEARGRGRLFSLARRGIMPEESPGGLPIKRRMMGSAFSRLGPMPVRRREQEESGEEDELPHKLAVQSSVVATPKEMRSRKDSLKEQSRDREGLQRNKRMFGLLLGTLQKFKTESKEQDQKAEQRKQIERKVEEEAEKEKKRYRQETRMLIEESQLEQAKITRLQQKMELVSEHEAIAAEMKKLENFLCTHSKPRIFWQPRIKNSATESKLKDSKRVVERMMKEKRENLEREINEVMEREQQREDRIRMRLRQDSGLPDKENANDSHDARDSYRDVEHGVLGKSISPREKKKHGDQLAAKKKHQDMQYTEEEEDMEEVEGMHIELGDREVAGLAKQGVPNGAQEVADVEMGEGGEKRDSRNMKDEQNMGFSDGNNTDVDYNDDEGEGEDPVLREATNINVDTLPGVGESNDQSKSRELPESGIIEQSTEGTADSLSNIVQEAPEMVDKEETESSREARRRAAVLAEDEEDNMDDEPADE